MITDLPNKILTSVVFNLVVYFMTNLRRTPSAFFTFYLFSFMCVLSMSMFFRSIGAFSRTLAQAMAPAAVLILALVIYTGFTVPIRDMHPWFRWINYLDPVAYAFEALMINEFHNRRFECSSFVPSYANVAPDQRVCSAVGAVAGSNYVEGDAYINSSFRYYRSHLWRNFGILIAMTIALCALYLVASEYISAQKSKGEVLLFRRGQVPDIVSSANDEEGNDDDRPTAQGVVAQKTISEIPPSIQKQTAQFHWLGVNYDIKVKGGGRRLLDDVCNPKTSLPSIGYLRGSGRPAKFVLCSSVVTQERLR